MLTEGVYFRQTEACCQYQEPIDLFDRNGMKRLKAALSSPAAHRMQHVVSSPNRFTAATHRSTKMQPLA